MSNMINELSKDGKCKLKLQTLFVGKEFGSIEELNQTVNLRVQYPDIISILLLDRTLSTKAISRNILWGNNNYISYNKSKFAENMQITQDMICGEMSSFIVSRSKKKLSYQKKRQKNSGEVFTPTWMVSDQNNEIENNLSSLSLLPYTKTKWLEITCGEGPYITTRYEMNNGKFIKLSDRVGFLDRKLKRITETTTDMDEWFKLVQEAYKASYGFEWNGDSLFITRENMLYSFIESYIYNFGYIPSLVEIKKIAVIISYNIFQMDGITFQVPFTEKKIRRNPFQYSLFEEFETKEDWKYSPGKRAKIMNWDDNKMVYFHNGEE